MTTDLSNKSVEELLKETVSYEQWDHKIETHLDMEAAIELARRLGEAQQQLELYAAEMSAASEAGFYSAQELWSAYQTEQQRNAAHDAKVAAEAKAEALEEFAYGWGPNDDTWTANDIRKLALEEAAEYRAKATEAGRKE